MTHVTHNQPLILDDITKRFGATIALDHASLHARAGTVHALLGENGAGKTTLMRIAFGLLAPDSGRIMVQGEERLFSSPADAIRAGIGMVHQHFALVGAMTVAENVALGLAGGYAARAAADRVRRLSAETGLALDPAARVDALTVEAQQRVEIVKALARDARILILDEPTAVLAPEQAADLLRWLRQFADSGHTVILITHKLREALSIADTVTVLRHGKTVLTSPATEASEDSLAQAMLGENREVVAVENVEATPPTGADLSPIIVAEKIAIADDRGGIAIRDASFTIHAGEIVGIAAIEGGGAGQHELLRALAGRRPIIGGTLTRPIDVGFVPEDRQRDALVLDFPLYENIALHGVGRAHGRTPWSSIRARTRTLLTEFDVRATDETAPARSLSGGNQQRLVLAREMTSLSALVAENPTRGLDLHATAAVHSRLRAARDSGTAIVLYASDIDETLALADRVLVLAGGSVREAPLPLDRDAIGRAMLALA